MQLLLELPMEQPMLLENVINVNSGVLGHIWSDGHCLPLPYAALVPGHLMYCTVVFSSLPLPYAAMHRRGPLYLSKINTSVRRQKGLSIYLKQ